MRFQAAFSSSKGFASPCARHIEISKMLLNSLINLPTFSAIGKGTNFDTYLLENFELILSVVAGENKI